MPEVDQAPTPLSSGLPRAGDLIGGTYRIRGQIGRGGMGAVFSATDERDGSTVAIKWVRPGGGHTRSRERLLREWKLARQIQHPNVVRLLDAGEDGGSAYLVMELLEGESLELWVLRGPFDAGLAVQLLMPVARGVAAAHAAGIIHRDLKPHNVILCREEGGVRPTLFDFGISRGAEAGIDGDQPLTQHGVTVGTPLYMAPEQLVGSQDADVRADVYALGVILYELLSGEVPFESDLGTPELLTEKIDRPAIPLSEYLVDVDPELVTVVARALERSPARRYGSVAELCGALEPFCASRFADSDPLYRGPSPIENRGATLRVRRRQRRPRNAWLLALAAVLVIAVAIVSGALSFGGDDPPPPPVSSPSPAPAPEPALTATQPPAADDTPPPAPTSMVDAEPEVPVELDEEPATQPPVARARRLPRPAPPIAERTQLPARVPRRQEDRGRSGSLRVEDF